MFSIIVPLFKEQKLFEFIKYNLLIKLELEELQGRNNNHINFTKLKGDNLFGVQSRFASFVLYCLPWLVEIRPGT